MVDFRPKCAYTPIMEGYPAHPEFFACRGCVCSALRRASRAVTQHYERAFRGTGLRATQFTLLAVLTQTGALAGSALGAPGGVGPGTVARQPGVPGSPGAVRAAERRDG